ncbi:MAG: hypothetical protein EA355_15900 [Rhodobacteraceae bacterium]|nr:MAG: hypothetical protein EA355_15900 [Paracoccaceae bacterium]
MRFIIAAFACALSATAATASQEIRHEDFDRVIVISTYEPKVWRNADTTPYPDTINKFPELFAMGGYRMEPPNRDNEWYARSYHWMPSTVVVNQGERVLLEFFGINGERHPSTIEGYDIEFEVRRGEITHVVLEADKPGIFRFASELRRPTMVGQIVVLPR